MSYNVRPCNRVPHLALLLICCTQICFAVNGQETGIPDKRVSLTVKNTSLGFVLKKLAKASGITIFFSTAEIAPFNNVSVNVRNTPFSEVMRELLDSRGLTAIPVNETAVTVTKKVIPPAPTSLISSSDTVISVSGKVVNEDGQPVVGASVSVLGVNKGATTDVNGVFTVKGISASSTLSISAVSVLPQQIPVKGRSSIGTILMKLSISDLDETVVKGYYNTTKRLNTGTVYTIKEQDLAQQPVSNPLVAMIGRVPNLVITPTSGLQQGAVKFQLRGQNSLNSTSLKSEPLIIVDGTPYPSNLNAGILGSFGIVRDQLSALSFLNVNDIEQIDVLTDADATSIYGSRGGNGVILITTKKGKVGSTRIHVNLSTGISKVPNKLDLLTTPEYIKMRRETYMLNGLPVPDKQSPDKNYSNYDLTVWDTTRNTDWQEEFFGRTASSHNAGLSINGGTSLVQYLIGGNYSTETFVYPGKNRYSSATANFSITGNSADGNFRSLLSGSYTSSKTNSPTMDFTRLAVGLSPNAPALYNEDGTLNWEPAPNSTDLTGTWSNPYAQLKSTATSNTNNLRANAELNYKIFSNFTLKASAGYSEIRTRNVSLNPIASFDPGNTSATGSSNLTNLINKSLTFDPQISYVGNLGNGKVDVLLGASIQSQTQENESVSAEGYTSDALLKSLLSAPVVFNANNSSQYKYAAVFARVGYNYLNKYLLNITGRRDGSSRFGPGYQFGNFWSTGLAWIFTEEAIIKKSLPFLSYGKLRASFGTSGNDGIGDYQYLELYQPVTNTAYQSIRPIRSSGVINPDYHWEKIKKTEIAIETGFFDNRVFFSSAYWRTRSSDQLGRFPLPATGGAISIVVNQDARIQNSGWDFLLSSKNINTKIFNWQTSANFGVQHNKLLALPNLLYNGYGINRLVTVGEPFTGFAAVYLYRGVNPITGLYQFENADGNINTDKDNTGGQLKRIDIKPLTLGISNSFSYKAFNLSFFVQLTKKNMRNYLFDPAFAAKNPGSFSSEPTGESGNLPKELLNRWKGYGDIKLYQRFLPETFSEVPGSLLSKARDSDLGYADASFIRLRNVAASYNIPAKLVQRWSLQNINIYLQAQNLLTITRYKGLDPEIESATSLPLLRTFIIGLQVDL